MLYEFEIDQNAEEAAKNICWGNQVSQEIQEANPTSRILRVSGEQGNSQSIVVHHREKLPDYTLYC